MKKQHRIIITITTILIIGWAMYLYYDFIQLKKESVAELKQLEKEAMAELLKPKGHIGFENKSNKAAVIKLTNENNDLVYWINFKPGGLFASYGTYDTGNITLELMRHEKVLHTLKFTLNKGGDVRFYVHKNKIKTQQKNL